jgi:hypothetical protein
MEQASPGEIYNAQARVQGWAGFCDSTLQFDWPRFAELTQLWQELRDEQALPNRDMMTARRLKDLLPDIALYERFTGPDGHWRHRVRLEGMRFVRIYGSHTGQVVQDYLAPEHANRFCLGLNTTLAAMTPLRFLARTDSADKNYVSAEFCTLPLADRDGQAAIILVSAHFSAVPWKIYFEEAMERLKANQATGQAKSLASAARVSAVKTAI